MDDSTRKPASPLTILAWILFGVVIFVYFFPGLLMAWPPDWVERRTQRRLLSERIESVGGWDALRRDCALLVEQHKDAGVQWFRHGDTNTLPAAIAALKPWEIRYYPPGSLRGSQQDTAIPVVRIRLFGMPSTGGNASPYLGLEVVCSTNTSAYEPRRGYSGGVPGNRHSTFRRLAENVFEIF